MGKRKRQNKSHAEQSSNLSDECKTNSVKAQGRGKKQTRKKNESAGHFKEKKGLQGSLSGDSAVKNVLRWTSAQEIVVLDELVKLAKVNASKPLDNSAVNWERLAVAVGERLDHDFTRTQLYEKARRLKEKYIRNQENMSVGKSSSLKNKDDVKIYKLSQKVWGAFGTPELDKDEGERDSPSGNVEQGCDSNIDAEDREIQEEQPMLEELERVHLDQNEQEQGLDNAGHTFHKQGSSDAGSTSHEEGLVDAVHGSCEQAEMNPKVVSQSNEGGIESTTGSPFQLNGGSFKSTIRAASHLDHLDHGAIKRTIETFQSEQQALLKDLQKSCMTVLKNMQEKFLSALSSTVRRSHDPWMGIGALMPSTDQMLQGPCQSSANDKKHADSDDLSQQWQKQHLQELKLTSLKLELMLDECKREKQKLEKLVLLNP